MSNSWDPDQNQHSIGPDLGPNCLQRLSADDTSKELINKYILEFFFFFHDALSLTQAKDINTGQFCLLAHLMMYFGILYPTTCK